MLTFNKRYGALALVILLIEFLIAGYVHDALIRPYLGDVLVVILLYCFVRTFLSTPVLPTAIGVLLFSYFVELLQYLRIVEVLGLGKSTIARIVIGTLFSWLDILCYTAGIAVVLAVEKYGRKKTLRIRPAINS
ncbi:ribosomal maturation YjgA family protein [Dawidia soli]|uniref:DUF2809 domain-containing protein n=1 Tax=Dawidia soli TaxID=2782352 RepID=A0AAP2DAK9_9BACT|nr:DUF2809 domain-containing protein [Dawidia soli]MBT1687090.1 DUF2809 domain-containing protein [Dawidia soli]